MKKNKKIKEIFVVDFDGNMEEYTNIRKMERGIEVDVNSKIYLYLERRYGEDFEDSDLVQDYTIKVKVVPHGKKKK